MPKLKEKPPYSLDELIKILEDIRDTEEGSPINIPKALYSLCVEIKALIQYLEIKDLSDMKRSKDDMILVCEMINRLKPSIDVSNMKQRWIRLFQLTERSHLEENLNLFLKEHPDADIKVWTCGDDMWYAKAMYSYPKSPTYFKTSNEEES